MFQGRDTIYPDETEKYQILASGPNFNQVRKAEKNGHMQSTVVIWISIVTYQFRFILRMNRSNVIKLQQKETGRDDPTDMTLH